MEYPKFIVSKQKEESISFQKVNVIETNEPDDECLVLKWFYTCLCSYVVGQKPLILALAFINLPMW